MGYTCKQIKFSHYNIFHQDIYIVRKSKANITHLAFRLRSGTRRHTFHTVHCTESAGVKESFTKQLFNNYPIIQRQPNFYHRYERPMLSTGKFFTNTKFS